MAAHPLSVHLLVVDDDDVDRERVLRLLGRTSMRFDAMEADSSRAALELLRTHDFDCVMLDNQLGDASGAELLPAIRSASRRACPVIMITGAGNESLAVHALQEGAADYLTKYQLSAETLARAIQRALESHRMRQELEELHQQLEARVEQQAAAIRQSERDLRAILDHTPTVIGYWDRDLRNRFGNRAHQRWLGADPGRLPGRSMAEVYGPERLARHLPRIEAVLRGESQVYEQDFLAPDGRTVRHAQFSLHPDVGDDGSVRGFYSSVHDVTAIKAAQARAEELAAFNETLFEQSPVGLGVFDDEGRCSQANTALAHLFGTTPAQMHGLALAQLVDDDVMALAATGRATVADGHPRRLDVDLHTAFGARLQATCAWARVDRDGRPRSLLAAQDMREQRRSHEALVAARDAAEHATRTKSEFVANMSHEIRTPMNAIVGLSRLALEDELPGEARGFIEKVYHAAQALMGILDDVLDYSKVEAGQLRIEHLPLDIAQVVQRAVDLFSARIEQKGLALEVELAPGLPRCVLGDPLRLSQVLNNLLGNAVKFTEHGGIRLCVAPLGPGAPAPDMVRFAVRDTGIGIDAAHRDALFEAFRQADGSITRRFGGTGLGLTISRRLVGLMHGSIGFDSEPGRGSEFWFTARLDRAPVDLAGLADAPPEPPVPGEAGAAATAGAGGSKPLQDLRVLLVEDNETNRLLARVVLGRFGATVLQAHDGAEALALLQSEGRAAVDVVLMDLQMPVMDGLEATRRLRALPALHDLPVIGMTAAAMAEDRARCLAAGMVDHLTKPIVAERLLEVLLHWSGRVPRPPERTRPPAIPGFDLSALAEMLRGNRAQIVHVVRSFVQQEAGTAAEIAALVARDEREAACRRLHKLRGGAGTLGANAAANAAHALEQALRQNQPVKQPLADFSAALQAALRAAEAFIREG